MNLSIVHLLFLIPLIQSSYADNTVENRPIRSAAQSVVDVLAGTPYAKVKIILTEEKAVPLTEYQEPGTNSFDFEISGTMNLDGIDVPITGSTTIDVKTTLSPNAAATGQAKPISQEFSVAQKFQYYYTSNGHSKLPFFYAGLWGGEAYSYKLKIYSKTTGKLIVSELKAPDRNTYDNTFD